MLRMFIALVWIIVANVFDLSTTTVFADDCSSHYQATSSPKTLTSPGYPKNYPDGTNGYTSDFCNFTIQADSNEKIIVLKFKESSFGGSDRMAISDSTRDYYHFNNYRNADPSEEYLLPFHKMIISLEHKETSDPEKKFFIEFYTAGVVEKSEKLTASNSIQTILSPAYPNSYPRNIVKLYLIEAKPDYAIELKNEECTLDHDDDIRIYSGVIISPMSLISKDICAKGGSGRVTVANKRAIVVFISDGPPISGKVFKLSYSMRYTPKSFVGKSNCLYLVNKYIYLVFILMFTAYYK